MSVFCCPVCRKEFSDVTKSLICPNGHCFDKAKSGYINLLLSSHKHNNEPGDNKQMVSRRSAFLSKGYYSKLKNKLCIQIVKLAKVINNDTVLLDVGCGEGYYTKAMSKALSDAGISASVGGIDISKEAIAAAAKRFKAVDMASHNTELAVASAFDLPAMDESVDILTEIFAPFVLGEFNRVLKRNGILLIVIPDEDHLYSMKKAIYDKPYKNEPKDTSLEGFELLCDLPVSDKIVMSNGEDIKSLFLMTPYSYKTSVEDTARLMALEQLKTEIAFRILCYKKK